MLAIAILWKNSSGAHSSNDISYNRKSYFVTLLPTTRSLQNFVVLNHFMGIKVKWEQNQVSVKLELWWKNVSWNPYNIELACLLCTAFSNYHNGPEMIWRWSDVVSIGPYWPSSGTLYIAYLRGQYRVKQCYIWNSSKVSRDIFLSQQRLNSTCMHLHDVDNRYLL